MLAMAEERERMEDRCAKIVDILVEKDARIAELELELLLRGASTTPGKPGRTQPADVSPPSLAVTAPSTGDLRAMSTTSDGLAVTGEDETVRATATQPALRRQYLPTVDDSVSVSTAAALTASREVVRLHEALTVTKNDCIRLQLEVESTQVRCQAELEACRARERAVAAERDQAVAALQQAQAVHRQQQQQLRQSESYIQELQHAVQAQGAPEACSGCRQRDAGLRDLEAALSSHRQTVDTLRYVRCTDNVTRVQAIDRDLGWEGWRRFVGGGCSGGVHGKFFFEFSRLCPVPVLRLCTGRNSRRRTLPLRQWNRR